ncbi:hypothetical protein D7Y15_08085 [Corallococcus sp. AB030]|uniref:hypothetical protein n=1 Tax=Corallococcus sp. AB030 TaxID=2316716 RepID=UPI000EC9A7B9|nr:hypothetical protein [Corallococcus sp. AB030]RKI18647.1 hypothetical protein D7Y15_08085 [Corallococcus sp. AB030]
MDLSDERKAELRIAAEAASRPGGELVVVNIHKQRDTYVRLHSVATPSAILALLAENERLRTKATSAAQRFIQEAPTGHPPVERAASLAWAMASDALEALGLSFQDVEKAGSVAAALATLKRTP